MATVVVGASRGPGRILFEQLRDAGTRVIGVARGGNGITTHGNARFEAFDARDTGTLSALLSPDTLLIHCAPPEVLTALLRTRPSAGRLVALGSTRLFTRFPDDKQRRVRAMVEAVEQSAIDGTILHPTMIYGAPGLNNIERILRVAKISPVLPLPAGGRSRIQPVYAKDVVAAILASVKREDTIGKTIILPGPEAMTYRAFAEQCIQSAGYRCRVISMPYALLRIAAPVTGLIPGIPAISGDELRRLLEDKAFDAGEARDVLGLQLTPLAVGLAETLSRPTPT